MPATIPSAAARGGPRRLGSGCWLDADELYGDGAQAAPVEVEGQDILPLAEGVAAGNDWHAILRVSE